jgi:hypothetical protein
VFDQHYESMTMVNDVDTFVAGVLRPYYLEHFSNLKFLESATPLDYESVVQDAYYENLVEYRLNVVTGNQIATYTLSMEGIRKTLELLEDELAE